MVEVCLLLFFYLVYDFKHFSSFVVVAVVVVFCVCLIVCVLWA